MAEIVLTAADEAVSEVIDRETALKYLENKDARKRAIGTAALARLGEDSGDLILGRLREESAKRKKKQRFVYWGFGIYGGVILTVLFVWLGIGIGTGRWGEFPWQLFQAFSYMGIFGSIGAASQFQKSATEVIARFDDIRYVPELVNALAFSDKHMSDVARAALTNLLPRLSASDSEILDTEQRKLLHRWLTIKNKESAFVQAILKALEQVGDERDLPAVQRMADREATTQREKTLRGAAQQCLPYVEQRAEQNRVANTLLRAATANESDTQSLLRPVSTAIGADPHLLRPANGSQEITPILQAPGLHSGESPDQIQSLDIPQS